MVRPAYDNSECITKMKRWRNLHHGKRKTFTQIARILNEDMEFPSPTGIIGGWHPTTVKNILLKPTRQAKRKRARKKRITGNDYLDIVKSAKLFSWCLKTLDMDFSATINGRVSQRWHLKFRRLGRSAKITLVLMLTGIRREELCKLRAQDTPAVHGNRELTVRGKGGTLASVKVTPFTETFLRDICNIRQTGYLLLNEHGKQYKPKSINKILAGVGRNADIGKLRPHMLRHSYASILLWSGCNVVFVRDQLRHSSIASTNIYAHVITGRLPDPPPDYIARFLKALNPLHPDNGDILLGKEPFEDKTLQQKE